MQQRTYHSGTVTPRGLADFLPQEVWDMIDTYLGAQGAALAQDQHVTHPHLG